MFDGMFKGTICSTQVIEVKTDAPSNYVYIYQQTTQNIPVLNLHVCLLEKDKQFKYPFGSF